MSHPYQPDPTSSESPEPQTATVPKEFERELRNILEAELRAGNTVAEVRTGGPLTDAVVVILSRPFLTSKAPPTKNLRYHTVNTPGWWSAEYTTAVPPHTLACR
jgi:hypothetical protein